MASGLPAPQYNNVDVDDAAALNLDEVRAWYAKRGVPWGARVPAATPWSAGTFLFRKELMALLPDAFVPAPPVDSLVVEEIDLEALEDVLRIDAAAFDGDPDETRPWLAPICDTPAAVVVLALLSSRPVGTAYVVHSDGEAGHTGYLGGVGVLPDARNRGIAGAMSSFLVGRALQAGARFVHCHPDPGSAAGVYRRLGFAGAGAFDVYVDIDEAAG